MDPTKRRERETGEAAQWWLRLLEEGSPASNKELLRWLRESPANVSEFLHMMHVHDTLKRFKRWDQIKPEAAQDAPDVVVRLEKHPSPAPWPPRRPWRVLKPGAILAGAVAIAALVAVVLLPPRSTQIATESGERRLVTLDDGSVVQLAPDTVLRVNLRARERDLWLVKGQALFHVTKDPHRAFYVTAGNSTVQSVGTVFDIETQKDNGMILTVTEGKVAVLPEKEVSWLNSPLAGDAPAPKLADGALYVGAGKQLAMTGAGAQTMRDIDGDEVTSWAAIRLVFRATPLSQVVEECNRYSGIKLVVRDNELASRPVTGVFNASDPETLLAFIEAAADVRVTPEGQKTLVVEARGSKLN